MEVRNRRKNTANVKEKKMHEDVRTSVSVETDVFDLTGTRGETGVLFLTRQHTRGIKPYIIQCRRSSIEKRLGHSLTHEHDHFFNNDTQTYTKTGFTTFISARDYLVEFIKTITGLEVKVPQIRIKSHQVIQSDFLYNSAAIKDYVHSLMGKIYNTQSRFGQVRFRYAVLLNSLNVCAISGSEYRAALDAAHIHPYSNGGAMRVTNGLALRKDLHAVFDRGDMAIDPKTLKVHFSKRAINSYHKLEGRKVQTVQPLDAAALFARWEVFCSRLE